MYTWFYNNIIFSSRKIYIYKLHELCIYIDINKVGGRGVKDSLKNYLIKYN